ncbi:norsolorinic acid reductase [Colletotrichum tofieldiae]|nr:norsolorinic acid reductase [Colletotrichum tofieldiae]
MTAPPRPPPGSLLGRHGLLAPTASVANQYQDEELEEWICEWLSSRGVRGEMVLTTKFSSGYKVNSAPSKIQSNVGGDGSWWRWRRR